MNNFARDEMQAESLSRARNGQSVANYAAIFEGFAAKGIAADQIKPRENVLTYNAWRALGRQVRRGEHGVKVFTFVEVDGKESPDGTEKPGYRMPKATTVFHISQTDEIDLNAPRKPAGNWRSSSKRRDYSHDDRPNVGTRSYTSSDSSIYADPGEIAADRWNETH